MSVNANIIQCTITVNTPHSTQIPEVYTIKLHIRINLQNLNRVKLLIKEQSINQVQGGFLKHNLFVEPTEYVIPTTQQII